MVVVQLSQCTSASIVIRSQFYREESAFAAQEQIPRAVGPRFGMTIFNKY
jgi:hypothetical protein